jgi:uncharacterized membrane protein
MNGDDAMLEAILIVLARAAHVIGGVAWAGSAIVMTFAIAPVLSRHAGDGAGKWLGMVAQRAGITSGIGALLTVVSGIYMFAVLHAHDDSAGARVLGAGALAALLSFALGAFVSRPAGMKLAKLQQAAQPDATPTAEHKELVASLRTRAMVSSRITLALLILSVAAMATFRYAQVFAS